MAKQNLKQDLPIGYVMCALAIILGCATIARIKHHEGVIEDTVRMIEDKQYILHENDYNLLENWE